MCQQWSTFRKLLQVLFSGKPGQRRVDMELFLIMHAKGGRVITSSSWKDTVRQDDHLSMAMIVAAFNVRNDQCPFPGCKANIRDVELTNGDRVCPTYARWAALSSWGTQDLEFTSPQSSEIKGIDNISSEYSKYTLVVEDEESDIQIIEETDNAQDSDKSEEPKVIKLYRQIHVQTMVDKPLGEREVRKVTRNIYRYDISDYYEAEPLRHISFYMRFYLLLGAESRWHYRTV